MSATFARGIFGKYNEETSMHSVIYGENAFLTEDELNEMQGNLVNKDKLFRNSIVTSGIFGNFTVNSGIYDKILTIDAGRDSLLFSIAGHILQAGANSVTSQPAALLSKDNRLIINLEPTTVDRTDLIILETWFQSMSHLDTINKFGGESTPVIDDYLIRDVRIGAETSRRLQYRWRIRVVSGQNDITNVNAQTYNFQDLGIKYNKVKDYYEAKSIYPFRDAESNIITDGIVRALPLFTIQRKAGDTLITSNNITHHINRASIPTDSMSTQIDGDFTFNNSNVTLTNGDMLLTEGNLTLSKGNLTVEGDLTVRGNTTSISTKEMHVNDNIILLNSGATGTPVIDAGIEIERGALANVLLKWDETTDLWKISENGTTFHELLHPNKEINFNINTEDVFAIKPTGTTAHKKLSANSGVGFNKFEIKYNSTENSLDFVYTP